MTRLEDSGFAILCRAEASPEVSTGAVDLSSFAWKAIWPFAFVGVVVGAVVVQRKLVEKESLESALFELNRGDEKKALEIVYQQNFDKLAKKASFISRDEELALESVQELFIPGGAVSKRLRQLQAGDITVDSFTTKLLNDLKNEFRVTGKADRLQEGQEPVPFTDEEAMAHWKAYPAIRMDNVKYEPVVQMQEDGSAIVRYTNNDPLSPSRGKVAVTRIYPRPMHRGEKRRTVIAMPKGEEGVDLDVRGSSPTDYVEKAYELEQVLRKMGLTSEQMREVRDEIAGLKEEGIKAIVRGSPGLSAAKAAKEYDRRLQEVKNEGAREGELTAKDLEGVKNYLTIKKHFVRRAMVAAELGNLDRVDQLGESLATLENVQVQKLGAAGLARAEEIVQRRLDEKRPKYGPSAPTRDFDLTRDLTLTSEERRRAIQKLERQLAEMEERSFSANLALEANQKIYKSLRDEAERNLAISKDIEAREKGSHVTYEGVTMGKAMALRRSWADAKELQKKILDQETLLSSLAARLPRVESDLADFTAHIPEDTLEEIEKLRADQERKKVMESAFRRSEDEVPALRPPRFED